MPWVTIANVRGPQGPQGPAGPDWMKGVLGPVNEFTNVNTAPNGIVTGWSGTNAEAVGLPESALGFVQTVRFGTSGNQLFFTTNRHIWQRALGSGGWSAWRQIDNGQPSLGPLGPVNEFSHADTAPDGWVTVWSGTNAEAVGLPESSLGSVFTMRWGNAGQQFFYPTTGHIWQRSFGSGGWGVFKRIDGGGMSQGSTGGGAGSGFKLVPLSLTLGQAESSAPASSSYRIRQMYQAPITRWRLCMTNRCVRNGVPVGTGMNVSGIWVGQHAGNGAFTGTPTRIATNAVIPNGGGAWKSGWQTTPIGEGRDMLWSFDYTSTTAPVRQVAGGWVGAVGTGGQVSPALSTTKSVAFDIWIEAETYSTTPVIATLGDSLASGATADQPCFDSTLSILCRRVKALPVHYAVSSDTLNDWISDPLEWKVNRWQDLSKPDVCLLTMGHNDVYGADLSLSAMQANFATALPIIAEKISPNIVGATITPRNAGSTEEHAVRNGYNSWLKSRVTSGELRDIFDFNQIITGGTNTINVAYNSDGIHFNTAGYKAQSDGITRRLTTPPVLYAS